MATIRVVDACMGRGKTSAAAAYMASMKGKRNFLYITPYLDEVDRICDMCDFSQPDTERGAKILDLKSMFRAGKDIASTHALFYLLDAEALELIRERKYSIIIDESIEMIRRENISKKDFDLIIQHLAKVEENGRVIWMDNNYEGKFEDYMEMAISGSLYVRDTAMLYVMNPDVLNAFDEVIMMTYLFGGQYQKAYLDFFGFKYTICGIDINESDDGSIGFRFTEYPDRPPAMNYKDLINIINDDKLNAIGEPKYALSKNWFEQRSKDSADIKRLRANLDNFIRRKCGASATSVIWTCFKGHHEKLIGTGGRYRGSFLSLTARATNRYRDRTVVAYIANRFIDPNVLKFFADEGITIDTDEFALSEMLQFIWRSAIRDGKKITVYIPSKRMRELLIAWINQRSKEV